MVIFFNLKRVRDFLMLHGEVYTIRKNPRNLVTNAVTGSFYKQKKIAKVQVTPVLHFKDKSELKPYVDNSGFKQIAAWIKLARKLHDSIGYLVLHHVKVLKKYLPWRMAPWVCEHLLNNRLKNNVYVGYGGNCYIMKSSDGVSTSQIIPRFKDTDPEERIVNANLIEELDTFHNIILIDKPVLKKTVVENKQREISDYLEDPKKARERLNLED